MLKRILIILEMIKFSHSFFALPMVILGCFLSVGGWFGTGKFILILLCMIFARNSAMAYNRIVDADIDGKNPRTSNRAIPAGLVSRKWTLTFIFVNSLLFILTSSLFYFLFGNYLPLLLSVPALVYIGIYSHLKRYSWLSHFWLGGSHAIAVVGGCIAVNPSSFSILTILLASATALWTAGFDIIYATMDIDFDRSYGLFSLPASFGRTNALIIARVLHILCIVLFFLTGIFASLGIIFFAALLFVGILLVYEKRFADGSFFAVNGVISVILSVAGILDLLLRVNR